MTSPDNFVQHNNYKPSSNHRNDPEMQHDDTRSKSFNGTTLSQASWMEHVEMRWNEDAAVLDDDDDDEEEEWMNDPLDAVAAKGNSSSSMSATAKDESIQRQPLHHRVEIQFDRCLLEDNHDDAVDAKKKMHRLPLQHPKTPYSRTRQQTPQSLGSYTSSMFFPTTDWLSATWSFGEDSTTAAARAKDCTGGSSSNAPLDTTADSDSVSIASMAYFEPTDFQTSNWMQAMDAPTVGLAVIALTTVITHPLIFCLGALTALGAATAAARGYDLVSDGFWNKWISSTLGNDETSAKAASSTAPAVDNSLLVADSTTTLPQTLTSSAPSHTDTAATHMSHVNANGGEATCLVDPAEKRPQKLEATVSTVLDDPITPANDRLMTLSTLATLPDFEFSDQSFALYFPPLEHDIDSKDAEFIGLNVNEFFRVFLDDKAVYNFYELQKKRGDLDIKYGSWQQLPEEGPLSLYPGAPQDFPAELDYYYFQSRLLRFRAKTNAFLGPAYATTARTQRILILSKRQAIMEMKTQVSDIPFGDRFFVMERWLITSQKEAGIYTTKVAASCQAFFSQNCPFESQIRTKSVATVTDVFTAWCTMAAEALKLTEQAKHDRLLQQQQQHDGQVLDETETGVMGEFRQQRRRRQHASSETENHGLSSSKPNVIDLSQSNNNNKMSCSNDSVEVEHCLVQHQSYVVGEDRPSPAMIQTPNTNNKEDVIVASSRPMTGTARLTKNRTLRRSESAPPLPTQQQHQQQQRMQPFTLFRRSWSRKPHSAASSPIPSL